ncbi:MAG TPA: hypothetical protein VFM69_07080 [Pricia sp.]|nr:hypothetical protein [Pricia sp.]
MSSPRTVCSWKKVGKTGIGINTGRERFFTDLEIVPLIAMFPLLGILIYFLIGNNYRKNKLYKRKLTRDRKVFEGLEEWIERSRKILKDNKAELAHFYESLSTDG